MEPEMNGHGGNAEENGIHEESDDIVTMVDVLEEQERQESEVRDVLGVGNDNICTYSKGYVLRQALYSCKTCNQGKQAGVCVGCSFACHDGHDLVELYTKRFFRCDCGTKALGNQCKLDPIKEEENGENVYNHNFSGKYCFCDRVYPDPENPDETMLQCIVCEDWYHPEHLKSASAIDAFQMDDLICHGCMDKLPFLWDYNGAELTPYSGTDCKRPAHVADINKTGAAMFPPKIRKALCRCSRCLKMYADHKVSFLTDEADCLYEYIEKMKENASNEPSFQEREMAAFNQLDHVNRINAIEGYNRMKAELMRHFQKFKDTNRVVSKEDIDEMFEKMKANRRDV